MPHSNPILVFRRWVLASGRAQLKMLLRCCFFNAREKETVSNCLTTTRIRRGCHLRIGPPHQSGKAPESMCGNFQNCRTSKIGK